jgi:hypothetical protein
MSHQQTSSKNPLGLCTWQDAGECVGCPIKGNLNCRFNWSDLLYFLLLTLPPAIAAIAGMMRSGFGWYLFGWAGYALFFFFIWEARILCSHCPYWAEEGRVLHCLANYGVIKIWRFHPEPMSKSEQNQFYIGAGILVFYPLPFLLLGGQYLLAAILFFGVAVFFSSLKKHVCTRCVNFSCPMNAVAKDVVDAYLRRNPVMLQAWEEKGYRLSQSQ